MLVVGLTSFLTNVQSAFACAGILDKPSEFGRKALGEPPSGSTGLTKLARWGRVNRWRADSRQW